MTFLALVLFCASLVGVVGLFALKSWEEKRGAMLAPRLRARADAGATELKHVIMHSQDELAKLGPTMLVLMRKGLHDLALGLAALSRASERQAHRLADMVSHKRNFERRESTNSFLKKVSDFKNGRSKKEDGLDSEA